MTGHKGERKHHAVALVTDDFTLYHRLVPLFESHGLPLLGLRPGEAVPSSVRALVGGPPSDARCVPLDADGEATLLAALTHLDRRPGRAGYGRVAFGVDPGKVIGLAAVADGRWLIVGEVRSVPEAVLRIAAWRRGLAADAWEAHVGDGLPEQAREIAAALRAEVAGLQVVLVPEAATSPGSPVTVSRHTDAAIHIAMRSPAR
jgi:hypothetical protein